jgi:hypothetical protein
MNKIPTFDHILDVQNYCIKLQVLHWIKLELFTPQFWLLIAILTLPWILWWKFVDKRRFLEIVIYGLLVTIVVTTLDEVGCQLNWWDYRFDIEPLFPRLIPVNATMLPVIYMLVYQYFSRWKSYIIANAILAAIFTFIGEPFMVKTGIYVLLEWKHIYSLPIYFLLTIIFKAVTNLIVRVQLRAERP